MGRCLSPILRQELANLDKDAVSRKSAMKALQSYVKDLDSQAIPLFLAQVSETKENGSVSGEYTISLYEVLARVHGPNVVPQIDSIMATIIKTLDSSAGSFSLQQACSKVVPAIARYAIDPITPEDKKRHIIHSLCQPLSDSLLGLQENLTSGAAFCLKALVDSDNWRFASGEMVNNVCQNVTCALEERTTQSKSHMSLVMALAKHNALIVEAYARLLIHSGLRILSAGPEEANSQKRLFSIQMLNFLMKSLDPRSIFSELEFIIEGMEKCQSDQMAYVKGASLEAMQTAKGIAAENGSKFQNGSGSVIESNFSRDCNLRRDLSNSSRSYSSMTPESQTVNTFAEHDSFIESPPSMSRLSFDSENYRRTVNRSVNRKLWRLQNGGVDVSFKDGLVSEMARGSPVCCNLFSSHHELNDSSGEYTDEFATFFHRSPQDRATRSSTPSPQRSHSPVSVDNVSIFMTPKKLVHCLQDTNDANSNSSEKQMRRFRSPSLIKCKQSPNSRRNGFSPVVFYNGKGNRNRNLHSKEEQFPDISESVSSTDGGQISDDMQESQQMVAGDKTEIQKSCAKETRPKIGFKLVFGLFLAVLAIFTMLFLIDGQDNDHPLVPT